MKTFVTFLLANLVLCAHASTPIKGPPIAEKIHSKQIVVRGIDTKILCPITGHPTPIIEWLKDNEVINSYSWTRHKTAKKSLKIKEVSPDDTGIYVCKGTNGFGTRESRIDLLVVDKADPGSSAAGPEMAAPVFTEDTLSLRSTYRLSTGAMLSLSCEALGQPDPEVNWYKDHVALDSGKNAQVVLESGSRATLLIEKLVASDHGLYTCTAKNGLGLIAKNVTLDVMDNEEQLLPDSNVGGGDLVPSVPSAPLPNVLGLPVFPHVPENMTVQQGEQVVMQCQVQSSSLANVKWLKRLEKWEYDQTDVIDLGEDKFKVIAQEDQQLEVLEDSSLHHLRFEYLNKLVIGHASETHTGMYYCFAVNSLGHNFKKAYLSVLSRSVKATTSLDSSPILIAVICLSVFVILSLTGITVAVVKKRRKQPPCVTNSILTESPELKESLMSSRIYPPPAASHFQDCTVPQQPQQHFGSRHPHSLPQTMNSTSHRTALPKPRGKMTTMSKLDTLVRPPPLPSVNDPGSSCWSSYPEHHRHHHHHQPVHQHHPAMCRRSHHHLHQPVSDASNYILPQQQPQNQYEVPALVMRFPNSLPPPPPPPPNQHLHFQPI